MSFRPDPANDPNDAYAVSPIPAKLRGPPTDWWAVTHNGVPVWFFRRALAERFATDAAFRLEFVSKERLKLASKKAHD
jgi:hypothetical protein